MKHVLSIFYILLLFSFFCKCELSVDMLEPLFFVKSFNDCIVHQESSYHIFFYFLYCVDYYGCQNGVRWLRKFLIVNDLKFCLKKLGELFSMLVRYFHESIGSADKDKIRLIFSFVQKRFRESVEQDHRIVFQLHL